MTFDLNAAYAVVEDAMPWVMSEDGTAVRGGCACKTSALGLWIAKCAAHRGDACQVCGERPATRRFELWLCDPCTDRMRGVWPFPASA